jgi:hypothetical protein
MRGGSFEHFASPVHGGMRVAGRLPQGSGKANAPKARAVIGFALCWSYATDFDRCTGREWMALDNLPRLPRIRPKKSGRPNPLILRSAPSAPTCPDCF